MNESCFSAVSPVSGWNQCVKCVAPRSVAHSFIASATASATPGSSSDPFWIVSSSARYASFGSRAFISARPNVFSPKIFSMSIPRVGAPRSATGAAPPFAMGVQLFAAASASNRVVRVCMGSASLGARGLSLSGRARARRRADADPCPRDAQR